MRIKLGYPMTLKEISDCMKGRLNSADDVITHISTDSREVLPKDLFIPLKGEKHDGESFVPKARARGAYVVSTTHESSDISVTDTSLALLDLAAFYNKNLPYILYRIGITGSVGKTTTKEFTKILMSTRYKTHANKENYNNEIGLPLSILSTPFDSEVMIMEMGMNHPGEISRLSKCLRPNISLITNIGTAHIGNLKSRENIAKAKLEIKDGMNGGMLLIPKEEKLLEKEKSSHTFSTEDISATFYLEDNNERISIYRNGLKYCEAEFALKERHFKKCLVSASALAITAGVSDVQLSLGISHISRDNTRQRLILREKYLFFNDCYNASPESISASYDSIARLENTAEKSLLLGDVLELGNMSEDIHIQMGRTIPQDLFHYLFFFGKYAEYICEGALQAGFSRSQIHINNDISKPGITAEQIKRYCNSGELILMKASRGTRLERVLDYFEE